MSYLVLARKWRPQNFDEVVGQPHVTRTLQNAVRLNRIAHAYLFTGARGVGKTSVARILAKTLNCESDDASRPCNACSNCREITQGNAVDVLEIDGASNRGIDSIRELRETVRYRPAKSRYKIYIIDEVHMLTAEAFNALLKTLEEPPDHVLFIFATTEPHKIPATILSRCQRFDFRRIATLELVEHLRQIAAQENAAISETVLYAIAREAEGSMRDAQSLLEQLLAFSADGLSDEEILDVLGVVDRRSVHRVGKAILEGNVRACLEVVQEIYRRGIDSRRFCQQLCDHFRNLLFCSLDQGDGIVPLDLPEDELKILKEDAERTTYESLYVYFQMILKSEESIRRSSLPRIALEMLLLRLTQLPRLESVENLLEKLAHLESRLSSTESGQAFPAERVAVPLPAPSALQESRPHDAAFVADRDHLDADEAEPPGEPPESFRHASCGAAASPEQAPPEEVVNRWSAFIHCLQENDPVLGAKLAHSQVVAVSDSLLELEVPEIYENAVKEPQSLNRLDGAVQSFWGRSFQWAVRGRSSLQPGHTEMQKQKSGRGSVNRMVLEDPVIQQALEILGGELIDIRRIKTGRSRPRGDGASEEA